MHQVLPYNHIYRSEYWWNLPSLNVNIEKKPNYVKNAIIINKDAIKIKSLVQDCAIKIKKMTATNVSHMYNLKFSSSYIKKTKRNRLN